MINHIILVKVKTHAEIKKVLSISKPPNNLNCEYLFELIKSTNSPVRFERMEAKIIPKTPYSK
jgi:hypothetical protein